MTASAEIPAIVVSMLSAIYTTTGLSAHAYHLISVNRTSLVTKETAEMILIAPWIGNVTLANVLILVTKVHPVVQLPSVWEGITKPNVSVPLVQLVTQENIVNQWVVK